MSTQIGTSASSRRTTTSARYSAGRILVRSIETRRASVLGGEGHAERFGEELGAERGAVLEEVDEGVVGHGGHGGEGCTLAREAPRGRWHEVPRFACLPIYRSNAAIAFGTFMPFRTNSSATRRAHSLSACSAAISPALTSASTMARFIR